MVSVKGERCSLLENILGFSQIYGLEQLEVQSPASTLRQTS